MAAPVRPVPLEQRQDPHEKYQATSPPTSGPPDSTTGRSSHLPPHFLHTTMKQPNQSAILKNCTVIYSYTRAQAVADGVQVEVTKTAQEAGIKFPVFLTRAVFEPTSPCRKT